MEKLPIIRAPLEVARFIGERLLGGGWSNLPAVHTRETRVPQRAHTIPDNIIRGVE